MRLQMRVTQVLSEWGQEFFGMLINITYFIMERMISGYFYSKQHSNVNTSIKLLTVFLFVAPKASHTLLIAIVFLTTKNSFYSSSSKKSENPITHSGSWSPVDNWSCGHCHCVLVSGTRCPQSVKLYSMYVPINDI